MNWIGEEVANFLLPSLALYQASPHQTFVCSFLLFLLGEPPKLHYLTAPSGDGLQRDGTAGGMHRYMTTCVFHLDVCVCVCVCAFEVVGAGGDEGRSGGSQGVWDVQRAESRCRVQ